MDVSATAAGVPVVSFVGVQQAAPKVRKADVQHTLLAEKATDLFKHINSRQLRELDELIAEDATCHVSVAKGSIVCPRNSLQPL